MLIVLKTVHDSLTTLVSDINPPNPTPHTTAPWQQQFPLYRKVSVDLGGFGDMHIAWAEEADGLYEFYRG